VEVRWTNGLEESWTNVAVNRIVTLTEGSGSRPMKNDGRMENGRGKMEKR
jgi:hypothetical protein